ncbi:PIG-L deacetylase family protein [Actinokineospora sp.]|uniref:PIG-L deacetylase family protein n=1 Tax=Actinokineospora sp. TaxID=1872133 RepID=UPI004037E8D0
MMISASAVLAVPVGLAAVGAVIGRDLLRRRVRRPTRVLLAVAGCVAVLLPANLYYATRSGGGFTAEPLVSLATLLALGGLGLLVHRNRIERTGVARPRRVLAVGAHPDDVELGCGATLAKLVDAGHEVRALVLSSGERGGDGTTRPAEVSAAGRLLGLAGVDVLSFPDTRLGEHENGLVEAIERVLDRFNPDIVLTHSGNDQHQDHRAVHLATLRAARRHSSILCYESPSATPEFRPSMFVDVEEHLGVKVAAVAAHRDQRGKPYMGAEQVQGLAMFRGAQAKVRHAEGYEPVRFLGGPADRW